MVLSLLCVVKRWYDWFSGHIDSYTLQVRCQAPHDARSQDGNNHDCINTSITWRNHYMGRMHVIYQTQLFLDPFEYIFNKSLYGYYCPNVFVFKWVRKPCFTHAITSIFVAMFTVNRPQASDWIIYSVEIVQMFSPKRSLMCLWQGEASPEKNARYWSREGMSPYKTSKLLMTFSGTNFLLCGAAP